MARTGNIRTQGLLPGALRSERLRRLHRFWQELRGQRRLPFRAEFAPEQFHFILGQMALLDVTEPAGRFRFRLVGTRLELLGRRGDQGRTVDEIEPGWYGTVLEAAYVEVVETGEATVTGQGVELLLDAFDWPSGLEERLNDLIPAAPQGSE
jgi:hypothetical protein